MKSQLKRSSQSARPAPVEDQPTTDTWANDNLFAADLGDPLFIAMARGDIAATRLW